MNLFELAAAFGGGAFGAAVGALPVFIMTGFFAVAGGLLGMAGIAEYSIGVITFGSFLGPHISFAGGVTAAAFAANKRKLLDCGADIATSPYGAGDYTVLLVGGVSGVLGYLIQYFYASIGLATDLPGATVLTLGILARLLLGKSGLCGSYHGSEKRVWFPMGRKLALTVVFGAIIGLVVSGTAFALKNAGIAPGALAMYPIVCFGFSAVHLIFTKTGSMFPATHHITLLSASAAVISGNFYIGVATAILAALFGDLVACSLNSYCDSHIDPPATTICVGMFIVNALFGA